MPIVDYNRIYGVRSRERQPVLYSPHMIPDAAGATMRASSPALSARLADADARARERQGSLRAQYAAIGNLIRVGGQVGETVARAVERRDEADFNALAAAWQNHMNAGARDAFQRRYARGGEGGEGADGPSRAIRDLDAAFDASDAFKNARDGVRERFGEWRTQHRQPYFDKADDRQADLADAWQKQVLEDRFAAADAGIKQLYEIGDNDKWGMAVGDAVEAKIALARWAYEKDGLTLSEDRQNKIENELLQGYFQDRASFQLARVAAADTPAGASEYENEVVALINSGVLDDPTRQTVEGLLSRARESRERNVAAMRARDNARANDLDEKVGMGSATQEEIAERTSLLEKMTPESRRHHEERELHTRSFLEFARWEDSNPMEAKSGETLEDAFARRKKAKDEALALPTPEARDMALRSIDRVFGPAERAYLDDVDAALYQMSLTGFWGGEMLSAYDQREKLRECAEKGLLQRGKASQYGAMIEAQEKDPEKRAARADAIRAALARYVRPAVLDNLLAIDPNRGVVLSKTYDPSGEWAPGLRTTGYWKNRSNEVVRMIAESVVKFDRLRATGAIKADKTLDQFLEETVGKSDAYLDSRDDEIIGNISAAMLSLDAEETAENVRRSGGFRSLPIMDLR